MKEYLKDVTVRDLQESDRQKCEGLGFDYLLEDNAKIFEKGNLFAIMGKSDYETYGKERLRDVVYIEHSNILNEDFLKVDFEKVANDPNFNKPKTVEVEFIENVYGTNESIFRSIENKNKYYSRQDNPRENCAKWYAVFKPNGEWEDKGTIKANITFKMGNETEKVSYSNWNGEGVYSKDYNKAFSYKELEKEDLDKDDIDICEE